MRSLLVLPWILACGSPPASNAPSPPAVASGPSEPWEVPVGFKGETIPFPLEFAPTIAHQGFEELRFAPGFSDPSAPGYWSYAFVWRTTDPAVMSDDGIARDLTAYFRGLVDAVDQANAITDREAIVVRASLAGDRVALTAHMFDVFKTKQPIRLAGWAQRLACDHGALWRFVLAPEASALRPQLDALLRRTTCDQPPPKKQP